MYKEYFGFKETPFSIAPDPRYLFMSEQHREALAHLVFGIHSDGGFVLLTGEVGTGKTTICRCLLGQLPEKCIVAFILNPKLTVLELLSTICDEFRIPYPEGTTSVKFFVDRINAYLIDANARGLKAVLLIDEAQNLSTEVLEQMRLLTNLETDQRKLLQIILIGQPELRSVLARPELRQLAQRIIARYHLNPLTKRDMSAYVNHRLAVAGTRRELFPPAVLDRLFALSGGIPRLINLLCDRSLLGAYARNKSVVSKKILKQAAGEVLGELDLERKPPPGKKLALTLGLGSLVAALILTSSYYFHQSRNPDAAIPEAAVETVVKEPAGESGKSADMNQPTEMNLPATDPAVWEDKVDGSKSVYKKPIPPPQEGESPGENQEKAVPADATTADEEKKSDGSLGPWAESADRYDLKRANEALFRLWGAAYVTDGSADACSQAESQQLQCYSAVGGLGDLSAFNCPAVLKLFSARNQPFYAVLSALSEGKATFVSGTDTVTVSTSEMALWWRGDYTLLWKPPPGYRRPLQVGDRSLTVEWLRSRLAGREGPVLPEPENHLFDRSLAEQVKIFQISQGLTPDGFVGPQTLMRLRAETEEGIPLLTHKNKDAQ
ncbi:AAA family ATPase [Desulforhabdus sp. TSK]|uniref:AAA family ATPase n=1 Tax=Desulforhabdus sp. TSK TaxID=2925014 RepID=UPI001FC8B5E4|nr:AAA family ATPase [Desulforhabdus sp. TSK]GKT06908.1 ATPase AAA [Desulforhabdus sp. TSK]